MTIMMLDNLLEKKVVFVGGKGGVGKTTSAAALAIQFASHQHKTLIISTDPAHSLGDVFNQPLSNNETQIMDNLHAIELDPHEIIHRHFAQVERTLSAYSKPEMMPKLRDFLKSSQHAPGAEEAAMLEAICQQLVSAQSRNYQHVIFDTAPTGHTLRLLSLPEMMQAWTDGLLAQQRRQGKLRQAAQNLDKQARFNPLLPKTENRWEQAIRVLEKRRQLFADTRTILHDQTQTAILLVLIPENLPLYETQRAVKQLEHHDLPCAGLIINQIMADQQSDDFWQQRANRQQLVLEELQQSLGYLPQHKIALHNDDIRGISALQGFW
ncbi:MAG: arsenic-transporting ATPase [Gammaproteobacteria bacterium]|nr:MAG: arsenic-transporting ATPase [Gammaproteobacteria bacterium]